jgi:hypothetical protein
MYINKKIINNTLLFVIFFLVLVLTLRLVSFRNARPKPRHESGQKVLNELPDDVENVLEGYKYSENSNDMQIKMFGKRIVRRGRQVLGLRSNLVKSNFYEDIRGAFRTEKGTLIFSASEAEWNSTVAEPLILMKAVSATLNGKPLHDIKSAKLYFEQGLLEVNAGGKETYQLK